MNVNTSLKLSMGIILSPGLLLPSHAAAPDVDGVLKKMEEAGSKLTSMRAEFTQVRHYALFGEKRKSSGMIRYKKPGKMRWDYRAPDNNSIYVNGNDVLMYLPDIKQVQKASLLKDRKTGALLIGFGNTSEEIKRNFRVKLVEAGENTTILELTPKTEEFAAHFQRLHLTLSHVTWLPEKTVRFEPGGDKTVFTFSKLKTNLPLEDSLFTFTIPKDVEVVEY